MAILLSVQHSRLRAEANVQQGRISYSRRAAVEHSWKQLALVRIPARAAVKVLSTGATARVLRRLNSARASGFHGLSVGAPSEPRVGANARQGQDPRDPRRGIDDGESVGARLQHLRQGVAQARLRVDGP